LEQRYSAEEEKRDEQITIEIYQVGHWETGLAECSGQENITSNMQQSCGSSHRIAKGMYRWFIQPTIGQNCRVRGFCEWSVEGN
jgi:hypothetical protein